jgi:hypothetical protein
MKKIMVASTIATTFIIIGVFLLILTSIPVSNTLQDDTLTIHFIIGKKKVDMKDAVFMPVPEETQHNLIRTGGTSLGRIQSSNFKNYKTGTRFKFYLCGKGEQVYFEIGETKYLIDNLVRK